MRIAPVSLKDALKERPGRRHITSVPTVIYHGSSRPSGGWTKDTIVRAARPPSDHEVVQEIRSAHASGNRQWTGAMLRTFDRLSAMVCSNLITDRARGRVWLERFIEKHGRETCDAMLDYLRQRDAQEWFKNTKKGK